MASKLSKSRIARLLDVKDVGPLRGYVFDVRLKDSDSIVLCRIRVFEQAGTSKRLLVSIFGVFKLFELDVANKELVHVEDEPRIALSMEDL